MKKFTKWEISVIKNTAKNVNRFYNQVDKLNEKISVLDAEIHKIACVIDSFEQPIKEMTGGYTSAELVVKGTKENGQNYFVLKYPETVIPEETIKEVLADAGPVCYDAVPEVETLECPPEEISVPDESINVSENSENHEFDSTDDVTTDQTFVEEKDEEFHFE